MALAAAYLALYLLLEWVSHSRPLLGPGITPWHPQAGLTLAFLIVMGPQFAVAAAIGAFAAQMYFRSAGLELWAIGLSSVWIAANHAVMAVLARRLLPDRAVNSAPEAATFAGLVGAIALSTSAGYVGLYIASGDIPETEALRCIARYWFADMNGVLMVTPLLLLAAHPRVRSSPFWRGRGAEIALQVVVVAGLLGVIFTLPAGAQLRFFYLLFLPVIWIGLRWNLGALFAVLAIQCWLIVAAAADILTQRFSDMQLLILTLSLTALLLGAAIAERRRAEQQLRERDAELARALRFATAGELASAATHELNQPMTALVSYLNAAEILASATTSAEEERLRATVRKAAHEAMRAAEVLHRLRDFYIGGKSRRERVRVPELCNAAAAAFADPLARSRIALEVFADTQLPEIEADETQLRMVLHNLIANAIDATAQMPEEIKRIEIRASAEDGKLTIAVEDSGAGISLSVSDRLFEPFVTSKSDGMGLGLAISRSLVRARGGEIASMPARRLRGARFCVTLPLEPPPADAMT
ncbi:MAG TPA: ATP-binding protein [Steroidobacteraceae bacterium]|nr:ATP-binding protein [Steroidobacteraceae bacterium]